MKIKSMLIRGLVLHDRLRPVSHKFVYPVFFLRLNLSEVDHQLPNNKSKLNSFIFGINCWRPISFYFKDHGARDGSNLLSWIRKILKGHQLPFDGEVYLQAFPRIFGYVFNPISLWYCYDNAKNLIAILAEVNNTFGEHHLYLLYKKNDDVVDKNKEKKSFQFNAQKAMHVSPFCEVKGSYHFSFKERETSCLTKIDYHDENGCLLKTAISANKLEMSNTNLCKALISQPFLTFGVMFRIHWQALLLWIKRVPFFRLPAAPEYLISTSDNENLEKTKKVNEQDNNSKEIA